MRNMWDDFEDALYDDAEFVTRGYIKEVECDD